MYQGHIWGRQYNLLSFGHIRAGQLQKGRWARRPAIRSLLTKVLMGIDDREMGMHSTGIWFAEILGQGGR